VLFQNREDAGRRLADRLRQYQAQPETVILGIPRGGLVVGRAVADALNLPLGVCAVHKLGAPGNPELAIGAVDDESGIVSDPRLIRRLGISPVEVATEAALQRDRLRAWVQQFGRSATGLEKDQTVILVDDGIATGATAQAGIQAARRREARGVVLAVPVAPRESLATLRSMVDELVCLATPEPFYAVGNFFEEWPQVTDAEVRSLLAPRPGGG
jgi:predicted phosphoribosyltransferase